MREPLKSMLENLPEGLHFDNGSLFAFCNDCNEKIEYEIRQRNIKEGPYYCRNCAQKHKKFSEQSLKNIANGAKKRSGKGKCTKCGKIVENRNSAGLCSDCYSYIKKIPSINKSTGKCIVCGILNKIRDQNGRGISNCNCSKNWYLNHNNSETMIKIIKERNIEQNGPIECSIHGHQNHSFAGKCILCINESKDYKAQSEIRTKTILKLIENGDLYSWPGGIQTNFIEKDNNLLFLDKSVCKYVLWNDYKEKFQKLYYDTNFKLPNGFKMYTTFRTQDSENWNGAKAAFEQNLVDNNINWFVYIKFFIDEIGNIKPLVVGKSGSLNVNTNGSDVSFSTDINDGPARRFLKENADKGFKWCKTKIAICKTKSEFEAYEMERNIAIEYNLFES